MPQNVKGNEDLGRHLASIDEIEKATGLNFFWDWNKKQQTAAEAAKPDDIW